MRDMSQKMKSKQSKMKKHILNMILPLALVGILATSCSKDDECQEVELADPTNNFIPRDDDDSETAQLRRQFKEETGSYLLFNDTIQHYLLGKDVNGEDLYFNELLDVEYSTTSVNPTSKPYTYTYLKTYARQSQAVDFVKEYILSHFADNLRPFSYLFVNTIYGKDEWGNSTKPYAVSGERAIVLALGELNKLTTVASKKKFANKHLLIIVGKIANDHPSYFTEFKSVSNGYYGVGFSIPDGMTKDDVGREYGFVGVPGMYLPTYEQDVKAYASLVLTYTDSQIETRYAKYPLIIKKAKIFRESLINMGYEF